jgi:hypothetical protein
MALCTRMQAVGLREAAEETRKQGRVKPSTLSGADQLATGLDRMATEREAGG